MDRNSFREAVTVGLTEKKSIADIAANLGISKSTAYRIKRAIESGTVVEVKHDSEIRSLKNQLTSHKKRYRGALDRVELLETELNLTAEIAQKAKLFLPKKWKILKSSPKEVTAFTLASDWHLDEIVDPREINGLNEYDLSIAKSRIEMYFRVVLKLLRMCRKESTINRLVIGALGDFISGWIHEELMEASSMTPTEAIFEAFKLWVNGLNFLLKNGELDEIDMICCCGNHSRITKKNEVKKSQKKSYEWILYQQLAYHFAQKGEERIKFQLPEGYFNWLTVYDMNIRFHHGNWIRYGGGVGGIHIPLRKAISQWNKAGTPADLDCLGHHHTRETSSHYVINSSVIGYNTYAQMIKADFAYPEQAFFIIHPDFGKTAEFPIVLK